MQAAGNILGSIALPIALNTLKDVAEGHCAIPAGEWKYLEPLVCRAAVITITCHCLLQRMELVFFGLSLQ